MSKSVIQVGADRVAYDGRNWTPVSGANAAALANLMRANEPIYHFQAAAHPDFTYNTALAAAEEWDGEIIEYQPNPSAEPDLIY